MQGTDLLLTMDGSLPKITVETSDSLLLGTNKFYIKVQLDDMVATSIGAV